MLDKQNSCLQSADVPAYLALPVCIIIAQLPLPTVSMSADVRKSLKITMTSNIPSISVTG
jgi:hypothetical protein